MSDYKEVLKQIARLNKILVEQGQGIMESLVVDMGKLYPELDRVVWHQYTPGFNDGSPCTFQVSALSVFGKMVRPETLDYDASAYLHNEDLTALTDAQRLDLLLAFKNGTRFTMATPEDYVLEEEANPDDPWDFEECYSYSRQGDEWQNKVTKEVEEARDSLRSYLERIYGFNVCVAISREGKTTVEKYECGY